VQFAGGNVFLLFNAAFAMAIMDLISRVDLRITGYSAAGNV